MDELPPHARRLLDLARTLDDPEPERRASADAALRSALAAHGVTNLPQLAARSLAAAPALKAGVRLSLGVKLALGAGAIAVLAAGMWQLRMEPRPKSAPATQSAPVQPPVPDVTRAMPADEGANAATPRHALRAQSSKPAHARKLAADSDAALRNELQLLAAVDGMVRSGRYRDALRRLSESAPAEGGVLAEERRALRVLALCGEGHAAAPHERAQFLARAPRSVLAERVRAACTELVDEP